MKHALLTLALAFSTQAFADAKDLKIFNALLQGGAEAEGGMSQLWVGVDNVACARAGNVGDRCTMQDISAANGNGAPLTMEGRHAYELMSALDLLDARPFDPAGVYEVQIDSIRCKQVVEGVSDLNEAERTVCDIDNGQN